MRHAIIQSLHFFFLTVFITACVSVHQTATPLSVTLPTTRTPQPTRTFTSTLSTFSHSKAPTIIPTQKPFQLPNPGWTAGIVVRQVPGEYHFGVWSPAGDEILYSLGFPTEGGSWMVKFSAPEFMPQKLGPIMGDFLWTQDGKKIIFHGSLTDDGNLHKETSFGKLWVIDRDGKNARQFSTERTLGNFYGIKGWKDDHTIIVTGYYGNDHGSVDLFDVIKEEWFPIASYWGNLSRLGKDYFAIDTFMPDVVYVAGEKLKHVSISQTFDGRIKPIPLSSLKNPLMTTSYFEDWQFGTNQMLVYKSGDIPSTELLLWDVDLDVVKMVAQNGTGGLFSPDGKILAYMTDKMHLYFEDLRTHSTFLNIPVKGHESYIHPGGIVPEIIFSPNSRYVFIETTQALSLNNNGWPTEEQAGEPGNLAYLLDLETQKVIWSSPTVYKGVWSPLSNRLVYVNGSRNLVLLNLENMTEKVLTNNPGKYTDIYWANSGTYFSVTINEKATAFVKIP